jgi:hypothetical protein
MGLGRKTWCRRTRETHMGCTPGSTRPEPSGTDQRKYMRSNIMHNSKLALGTTGRQMPLTWFKVELG